MKQSEHLQSALEFVRTHVHTTAHDTEIAAAEKVAPKVSRNCGRLLLYIYAYGPATRDRANEFFSGHPTLPFVAQQRLSDLYRDGLIEPHPVMGTSNFGNPMKRWVITDKGREVLGV